jgi:hypothetical protein
MTDSPESVRRTFQRGAEHGVIVWLIYATLEVLLSAVLFPQTHGFRYTAPDIRMTLVLFVLYPLIGFSSAVALLSDLRQKFCKLTRFSVSSGPEFGLRAGVEGASLSVQSAPNAVQCRLSTPPE